ncbi:hypothetical protein A1O3_01847 [Capronia epimyces CBS 606.96]|uniref:C2 domain-containing protein n=1 Tax=Capronia epimyces CBS 606.96 TaxID=1182542 RepID=W9Y8B9_9EURO|nr:uncharacterized protein A1O3_01847 [Capronia epimyces CBS 606.96]EXJ88783.1 hypothetical protein A1O3_01847 [Capronia epimyces CBS 606.96]
MAVRSRAVNAAHTAGIFADMSLDGPEIGTLVAVVDRARNLPNRKTMGKQDPYCAMRLGKEAKKTNTDKRGGQTPKWDQELRFTVHDSLDYYKLKCSVFNDDKKTDLIGEAWIDLREVIVPGGGQNDLWHQLNFKGKYAGDVRVELTYYDTRPPPEPSSEKKMQREKAHSVASDALSTASTSRQLGPREIKRRPLPPGPSSHSSPAPATQPFEQWPSEEMPSGVRTSSGYTNSHPPPRPPKQRMPETPDDVGYGLDPRFEPDPYDTPPRPYAIQDQRPNSHDSYSDYDRVSRQHSDKGSYRMDPYESDGLRPVRKSLSQQTGDLPSKAPTDNPIPDSPRNMSNQSPYHSSPPVRTPPKASSSMPPQPQPWQSRSSTSPTKHVVYRDSPLRQSISHVDLPLPDASHADPRFDEDECPPPPPAHRDQIARIQTAGPSYLDSHGHLPPQTPLKYSSVEDRSPLQKLERDYGLPQGSSPPIQRHQQQPPPIQPYDQRLVDDHRGYSLPPEDRRNSHNDNMLQLRPSSANEVSLREYAPDRSGLHERYNGNSPKDFRQSVGYGPPRRAQTFDATFETYDDRQIRGSEPAIIPPRSISPGIPQTIPRKSITPTPTTPEHRNSIGSTPYGPDSYDVLNPGTSPTVEGGDPYAIPDQSKDAPQQRELDRLRDQGPIIGNDGRVIDPSDHLPADTWAPEPERKNRQPEHVIRVRTKEEARMQNRGGSLPASAMPRSMANSSYQPSPTATPSSSQSSPVPSAPSSTPPQPESTSGRNRLRKQMPNRPLPAQPYPLPQSSPALVPASSNEDRASPSSQRYTISSSPAGPFPQRPSLSEYQTPATDDYDYSARGAPPLPQYYSTPTKVPSSRRGNSTGSADYGQEGSLANASFYGSENSMEYKRSGPDYGRAPVSLSRPGNSVDQGSYVRRDSLALELSTIDIGPSRSGRTALRPVRGYGGY